MVSSSSNSEQTPVTQVGLLDALRRDAMSRVIDGSVFRGADSDAMYDLIAQAESGHQPVSGQGDQASPVTANVVALLQQPGFYRGQIIEVVGKVALVETVLAKPKPIWRGRISTSVDPAGIRC